jgi:hypothetical protein
MARIAIHDIMPKRRRKLRLVLNDGTVREIPIYVGLDDHPVSPSQVATYAPGKEKGQFVARRHHGLPEKIEIGQTMFKGLVVCVASSLLATVVILSKHRGYNRRLGVRPGRIAIYPGIAQFGDAIGKGFELLQPVWILLGYLQSQPCTGHMPAVGLMHKYTLAIE